MFKKSPLKATKLHRRKRRAKILRITFIICAVFFVFGLTVWISRVSFFRLNKVVVQGNAAINSQDIEFLAQKQLAGAYAGLYAKSNKLIYPKDTIEKEIRATFPNISTLAINTEGHALEIKLTERKPTYIWCKGTPGKTGDSLCYLMDETGYIFAEGPQISGNAYVTFYGGITDENPIGKVFLNEADIKNIEHIKKTLDANNISVKAYTAIPDHGLEIVLTSGGKIILTLDQNPEILSSSIELLKQKTKLLDGKGVSRLEYIDLRFGNKVYYKFVGDNAVQTGP